MTTGTLARLDLDPLRLELVDHCEPVRACDIRLAPAPPEQLECGVVLGNLVRFRFVEELAVLLRRPARAHHGDVAERAEVVEADIERLDSTHRKSGQRAVPRIAQGAV